MKDVPNRKQGNGDELVDVWTVWLWGTCPAEIDERKEELMEKGDKEERSDDGNNGGRRGGWKNAEGITERQERKEDERKAEASARSHLLYIRQGRVLLYLLPHDDVGRLLTSCCVFAITIRRQTQSHPLSKPLIQWLLRCFWHCWSIFHEFFSLPCCLQLLCFKC